MLLQSEVLGEAGLLSQAAGFTSTALLGLPALFWLFVLASHCAGPAVSAEAPFP